MAVEDRGPELLGVIILFLVLSWATVLLRCWVRVKMIKAFAIDDWLILVTLGFFTIYSGLVCEGVRWGVGKHMKDLTEHETVNAMHMWYFGEILYILATSFLRLAVGAFILRIAVRKSHRNVIHGCNIINVLFNLFYLIFTILQCSPVDGFWLRFGGMKHVACRADISVASTYAASGLAAAIDWTFGILPLFILWDLNVSKRKKFALAMIMGLGAVASTAPIVRIPYTKGLSGEHEGHDFLWETVDVAIWSAVEPGLGITAVSLVTLRPLFVSLFKGSTNASRTPSKQNGDVKNSWTARAGTPRYGHHSVSRSDQGNGPKPMRGDHHYDEDDDNDVQLHGLPPILGKMGHTVTVEGGLDAAEKRLTKLTKSNSTRSQKNARNLRDSARHRADLETGAAMEAYHVRTWSRDDLSQSNLDTTPSPSSPLDCHHGSSPSHSAGLQFYGK